MVQDDDVLALAREDVVLVVDAGAVEVVVLELLVLVPRPPTLFKTPEPIVTLAPAPVPCVPVQGESFNQRRLLAWEFAKHGVHVAH